MITITRKIKTDVLEGVILAKALTYPERIAESKKSIVSPTAPDAALELNQSLDRAESYYDLALRQVITVDVKIIAEDRKLTSVDELMVYEEGQEVVISLASDLISGVTLGNGKSKG